MFLQRTLSYMKDRRTKVSKASRKKRKEFKLDGMLDNRKTQMDEILQKDDTDDDSYRYTLSVASLRSDLGKLRPAGQIPPFVPLCPARVMPIINNINETNFCLFSASLSNLKIYCPLSMFVESHSS